MWLLRIIVRVRITISLFFYTLQWLRPGKKVERNSCKSLGGDLKVFESDINMDLLLRGSHHMVWKCSVCAQEFNQKTSFKEHIKAHLGQWRHQCEFCGKGFMKHTGLEGHLATHTRKKQYTCPVCAKEFSYRQSLVRHVKQSHNEAVDLNMR